ncbi:hypothetical protein DTO212C5_124 [Paecilomyces variotii]|nr:hypothetical protein DTO212C5_124 [Paecilomyces variotii]
MAAPGVCTKAKAIKSSSSYGSSDPFIVATGQDSIKPDASSRRFIRRHVMKGKNRKPIASSQLALGSWINNAHDLNDFQIATTSMGSLHRPFATPVGLQLNSSTPSLLGFAEMEPRMLHLIYDFVTVMKKMMYPVECCVDLRNEEQNWFRDLSHDPAYAHTILSTARAYFDFVGSQTFGPRAIMHMNKTMFRLRNKLAETDLVITDSTIFTVLALVLISEALDDHEAAQKHLHGLHELVKLRGGIKGLAQKPLLQIKCCRIDLSLALKTGSKPLFFTDDSISWKPYLLDCQKASTITPVHTMCDIPDIRLVNVWLDLRELTTGINLAHQTQCKVSSGLFQEALISVQYRLQHLSYNVHDKQEVLRVAMLTLSIVLLIDIRGISIRYQHLAGKLRAALQSSEHDVNDQLLRLALWLLFVGRVSLLDGPEDALWLGAKLLTISQTLGITTWPEARHILKSFMWVDGIHDKAGKDFFEELKES